MTNDSYFQNGDDDKMNYKHSHKHKNKWIIWKHTAPYIAHKIIEAMDLILGVYST